MFQGVYDYLRRMKRKLLIIGTTWPEPTATAAGGRMQRLIGFFLSEGYQITFASTASVSDLSMNLEQLGIHQRTIRLNHRSFDTFIKELQPQMVLFDRFPMEEQFGWRVAEFAPQALRVLDTEDLHSLRKTKETTFKQNIEWTTEEWLKADIAKREIASIYRSDVSLIISSVEMQLLENVVGLDKNLLLHLPFMLKHISKKEQENCPAFEERIDFIFMGNGKHTPNLDAISWLNTAIWPLIRMGLPNAKLHIYGAYLPQKVVQMNSPKQGFLVHGRAENKQLVFQRSRVNLAPLRFGAGLKGKLIDAMQYGTPSVTTTIGAEGMHGDLLFSGTISNEVDKFAQGAIALHNSKDAWLKAQQNGFVIVNQIYDDQKIKGLLAARLEKIYVNLEKHRAQNFTGSLLQHHTLASNKYMSKWISAKNGEV